jgi:hypothetical protein
MSGRDADPLTIRWPIATASAIASLTLPGTLMLFIARADIFTGLGIHAAVLLAAAITLPVFMIAVAAAALSELRRLLSAGATEDMLDELTLTPGRQWNVAFHAGVITNAVMYPGAAVLYFERDFGLVAVLLAEAAVLVVLLAFTAARCAYLSIRNEARRRREAVKTAHDPHAAAVRDAPLGLGL